MHDAGFKAERGSCCRDTFVSQALLIGMTCGSLMASNNRWAALSWSRRLMENNLMLPFVVSRCMKLEEYFSPFSLTLYIVEIIRTQTRKSKKEKPAAFVSVCQSIQTTRI